MSESAQRVVKRDHTNPNPDPSPNPKPEPGPQTQRGPNPNPRTGWSSTATCAASAHEELQGAAARRRLRHGLCTPEVEMAVGAMLASLTTTNPGSEPRNEEARRSARLQNTVVLPPWLLQNIGVLQPLDVSLQPLSATSTGAPAAHLLLQLAAQP